MDHASQPRDPVWPRPMAASAASTAAHANHTKCLATAKSTDDADLACFKAAFTDCVATTKGDVAGSKSCHENDRTCLAK